MTRRQLLLALLAPLAALLSLALPATAEAEHAAYLEQLRRSLRPERGGIRIGGRR